MSLANIIRNMQTHLNNAYDALEEKGATIPEAKNLNNLATTVQSVTTGGGETPSPGGDEFNINGIIEEYYVYAGDNISAGDFVNYIEGIANRVITNGVSVDTTETIINNITRSYAYRCRALLLEDQKRVLLTHSYSSHLYIQLLKVEDGVISTVSGTDKQIFSNEREWVSMVEIDNNKVIVVGIDSDYNIAKATIVTIGDDDSLTIGSTKVIISSTCYNGAYDIHKIGDNKAIVIYSGKDDSTHMGARILTVSGTTITMSPITTLTPTGASALGSVKINNNQIFVVHAGNAFYCNINDDIITESALTTVENLADSWTRKLILINPTTALLVSDDETNETLPLIGVLFHLDVNITNDGVFIIDETPYSAMALDAIKTLNNKIIITNGIYSTDFYTNVIVGEIINNIFTVLTNTRLVSPTTSNFGDTVGQNITMFQYKNDDFGIVYDDGNGDRLAARIYSLDNETNLIVPIAHKTTIETTYETQVQKSKADVFNGVAKTAGVGGDDMGHNEKIEIYTL